MADLNGSIDEADDHQVADPPTHDTPMSNYDTPMPDYETPASGHDTSTSNDDNTTSGHETLMSDHETSMSNHEIPLSDHDEDVTPDDALQNPQHGDEVQSDIRDIAHEDGHYGNESLDHAVQDNDIHAEDFNEESGDLRDTTRDDQGMSQHDEPHDEPHNEPHDEQHDEVLQSVEEGYDWSGGANPGTTDSSIFEQSEQASHRGSSEYEQDTRVLEGDALIQSQIFREPSSLFVPEEGDHLPTLESPTNAPIEMNPPAYPLIVRPRASVELPSSSSPRQSATPLRPSATPSRSTRSLVALVQAAQNKFNRRNASIDNATQQALRNHTSATRDFADQDDNADKKAAEDFARRERHYEDIKNRNGGKLTFKQEVEWFRICNDEETRRQKRKHDRLLDQEADGELFPEIGYETRTSQEPEGDEETGNTFEFSGSGSQKRRRTTQSDEPSTQLSMQEAEYESMMVACNAMKDMPGKRRGKRGNPLDGFAATEGISDGKPRTRKPKAKKASRQTKPNGERLTAKEKRAAAAARIQLGSLVGSNVFEQQASEDAAEQPTFESRVKADALKEIIAGFSNDDKESRHDFQALKAATKDFNGRASVKADKGAWKVRGMETSLKPYQLLGAAWMRRKENGAQEPRGGLLADQMGLGKTLMMLANIVNGRPLKNAPGPKTTLLVASPALLDQWASEIKKHTNCDLAVMRYASGNRVDSNRAGTIIDGHDIVLTTWDEVRKSYPKFKPPVSCETDGEKLEWWIEEHKENRGNLHRIEFLRIVLDEAQAIKNHKSQTSIACRGLIARHKWAMSGTPILNGLFELYPYFKFIGVPHTGDFEDFEENYCNIAAGPAGVDRLHIRLSQFMLRRTHSDKMFGAPILKLPRADQSTYWCDFNPVERIVYDIVWKRFLERMAEMLANTGSKKEKKGPTYGKDNESEEERSYNCILVLFLRLRQLCSHILMLQFVMKDLCELEDIKMIEEVVRTNAANRDSSSGRTIIAIRKQLDDLSKQQASKVIDSDDEDLGDDTNSTADATADATEDGLDDETSLDITTHSTEERQRSGRSFGKAFDFDPFLKSLKAGPEHEQRKKRALCSWCGKPAQAPWSMSCSHLICKEPCMEEVNIAIAEQGNEHSACKTCGTVPDFIHPGEDEGSETPDLVSHGTRSGKRKNRKRTHIEREVFPKNWLETIDDELLPSTKTIAVKAQILNWIKEDKDVKIIVFTQFLPMIQIMARICYGERWGVQEYTGKMSFKARQKALNEFAEKKDVRVLLASMRCGGLGLNLTMAQKVIMVDPWWNAGSEQQAFCRVFRIGQSKKTYLSRVCVRRTIDERMIEMQEEKQEEIDEVFEAQGEKKFTFKDLLRLFGNVGDDANGRPFSFPDTPDTQDGLVYPG